MNRIIKFLATANAVSLLTLGLACYAQTIIITNKTSHDISVRIWVGTGINSKSTSFFLTPNEPRLFYSGSTDIDNVMFWLYGQHPTLAECDKPGWRLFNFPVTYNNRELSDFLRTKGISDLGEFIIKENGTFDSTKFGNNRQAWPDPMADLFFPGTGCPGRSESD